jgi:hypothetical protein
VSVSRCPGGIRIANEADEPLAYAVWNRDWLGLFAPCFDGSAACLRLGPKATVTIAAPDIVGYAPGMREAIVRVWRVAPDGAGGYQALDLEEFIIAL